MGKLAGIAHTRIIAGRRGADRQPIKEKTDHDDSMGKTEKHFDIVSKRWAEFKRACHASKLIRSAFDNLLNSRMGGRFLSRLVRELIKVIQSDLLSEKGYRNITDGQMNLLEGFEFNRYERLSTTFSGKYSTTIDRGAGTAIVEVSSFVPKLKIIQPDGATHFRIQSSAAELNFEMENYSVDVQSTGVLAFDAKRLPALKLVNKLRPASTHSLLLVLGIEYYREANGNIYPLEEGKFNVLAIVKASNK